MYVIVRGGLNASTQTPVTDRAPRRVAVPSAARALSELERIDYEDAFALDPAADRSGEEWARALLEDATSGPGRALWSTFALLGVLPRCDASVPSGRVVAGWELKRSAPDFALLSASARIGLSAELLFQRQRRTLVWTTFVQFVNPLARGVWSGLAPVHRQVVPYLLTHADER